MAGRLWPLHVWPGILLVVFGAIFIPAAEGSERTLYWRALDVAARLEADGRLRVRERQTMVFTGDWNGGERRFRMRLGQRLTLNSLEREEPRTSAQRVLAEGSLDRVDQYDWVDSTTLRWRSRLPSDPPFQETEIIYTIDYTLANILVPQEEGFLLDHDFAFPDRNGDILSFSLHLALAETWEPLIQFPGRWSTERLAPGRGFVIQLPLDYVGEGRPSGVLFGAGQYSRWVLVAALVLAGSLMGVSFRRREKSLGRFEPPPSTDTIEEGWLRENLFSFLPEEVGAAWDRKTSAAEVAAVLARMAGEGRIQTEVYRKGFFKKDHLRMKLLVPRDQLSGYEKTLVEALFVAGTETDTEKIRRHYKDRGFDPASKIRAALEERTKPLLAERGTGAPSPWITVGLVVAGAACMALSAFWRLDDLVVCAIATGVGFAVYMPALFAAWTYRDRLDRLGLRAMLWVLPVTALGVGLLWLLLHNPARSSFLALLGIALSGLAVFHSITNQARSREELRTVRLRKKLLGARGYFQEQLRRPDPALRDEWLPYLVAFGLGPNVDRWFRAYGAAASSASLSSVGSGMGRSAGSSGATVSRRFTGGGGAFGGAGATGSWASAIGAVAAGVPSPSSSGGGGGGGGSSGGGGGGGW